MANANIRDNAEVWLSHLCQTVHFPKIRNPHLHHCRLMLFLDPQQCQWKPNFIIVVPSRLQYMVFLGQHRSNHLLGAGFAYAPSYPNHRDCKLAAVIFCNILQCLFPRLHQNIRPPAMFQLLFREDAGRPFCTYFRDKLMPVHFRPFDRDKQETFLYLAAVRHCPANHRLPFLSFPDIYSAACLRNMSQCHISHNFLQIYVYFFMEIRIISSQSSSKLMPTANAS